MGQHSILIVEQDPGFGRTLAQALVSGSEGRCQVEVCPGAEEAWTLLAGYQFDVLISSDELPGEDGHSLIEKVQKQYPHIGTILLAGEESPQSEACNQHYLTRPFDMLDLLLLVQQIVMPKKNHHNGDVSFRLLIVEDDDGLRRVYTKALSKFNRIRIDEAATMDQARNLLDLHDYDILISDIRIGRERATDILEEYKQRLNDKGTKIVLCSAFGQYRNLPENVDHFLEKPIAVEKLINLVGALAGVQVNGSKDREHEGRNLTG